MWIDHRAMASGRVRQEEDAPRRRAGADCAASIREFQSTLPSRGPARALRPRTPCGTTRACRRPGVAPIAASSRGRRGNRRRSPFAAPLGQHRLGQRATTISHVPVRRAGPPAETPPAGVRRSSSRGRRGRRACRRASRSLQRRGRGPGPALFRWAAGRRASRRSMPESRSSSSDQQRRRWSKSSVEEAML